MSLNGPAYPAHPGTDFTGDKGFTIQGDRDEADINKIVARLEKGATLVRMNAKEPFYGDVSFADGLADAIMKVQKADELFMQYPADVRERFDNDKTKFIEFLEDESNYDEALKLGLVLERPKADPSLPVPEPVGDLKPV